MYNNIFFTNVLRILEERGMTKQELAELSGVSTSFLSDITSGKGNPTLNVVENIASALDMPLPALLETTDLDDETLALLNEGKKVSDLPEGYERITVVLPGHRAFLAKKWGEEAKNKLNTLSEHQEKE